MFLIDPEKAHHLTVSIFRTIIAIPIIGWITKRIYCFEDKNLEKNLLGLKFKNPIGLAAGFDKDGKHFETMSHLGFGFIEIGTVTPLPQIGNEKPRLFRLAKDESLINRMGFNNDGVDALVERLKKRKKGDVIIGGNIGKNKITPNEKAVDDYVTCFSKLHPYVDYFVVNVSSPNTPGLRKLQEKGPLTNILQTLQNLNEKQVIKRPILLKIAPDLTESQLDDIIEIVQVTNIAGIIATNTTIDRNNLKTSEEEIAKLGNGGLSGKAVQERSTKVISYLHQKTHGKLLIIGVGGINGPKEAIKKLDAGASLIQVYSCMIYEGPGMVKTIKKSLVKNKL